MKLVKMLVALTAIVISTTVCAQGSITNGTITGVQIGNLGGSMAFVSVSGTKSGNPTCSVTNWAFVLPLQTPLENQMLAMLLSAYATQTAVSITGNGLCNTQSQVETLDTILSGIY